MLLLLPCSLYGRLGLIAQEGGPIDPNLDPAPGHARVAAAVTAAAAGDSPVRCEAQKHVQMTRQVFGLQPFLLEGYQAVRGDDDGRPRAESVGAPDRLDQVTVGVPREVVREDHLRRRRGLGGGEGREGTLTCTPLEVPGIPCISGGDILGVHAVGVD